MVSHCDKRVERAIWAKKDQNYRLIAGSLESAYSLNWGAQEIWGNGGGETLAPL